MQQYIDRLEEEVAMLKKTEKKSTDQIKADEDVLKRSFEREAKLEAEIKALKSNLDDSVNRVSCLLRSCHCTEFA